MKTLVLIGCLWLTGCAGSIFSHKPYHLSGGTIIYAMPEKVVLEWPNERRYWCGPGNNDLCMVDWVHHVCPETVPALGSIVNRVDLAWQKSRKCWKWENK